MACKWLLRYSAECQPSRLPFVFLSFKTSRWHYFIVQRLHTSSCLFSQSVNDAVDEYVRPCEKHVIRICWIASTALTRLAHLCKTIRIDEMRWAAMWAHTSWTFVARSASDFVNLSSNANITNCRVDVSIHCQHTATLLLNYSETVWCLWRAGKHDNLVSGDVSDQNICTYTRLIDCFRNIFDFIILRQWQEKKTRWYVMHRSRLQALLFAS